MTQSHTSSDLIDNPSCRCPVALVLDTSGSMSGTPITELNAGMQQFLNDVKADDLARWSVDLAIYTAGGTAKRIQEFQGINSIEILPTLNAGGQTPLGAAVKMALHDLEQRKVAYKNTGVPYYQPWLVIISDGSPTDSWQDAARYAKELSTNRKLVSMPIGVQGADLAVLSDFSSKPAVALNGLDFRAFFEWLSASMARVSASASSAQAVSLPSIDPWGSI